MRNEYSNRRTGGMTLAASSAQANRNKDLDKGLGARMFSGIVTAAQDHADRAHTNQGR